MDNQFTSLKEALAFSPLNLFVVWNDGVLAFASYEEVQLAQEGAELLNVKTTFITRDEASKQTL